MPRVKGTKITSKLAFVRERHGDEGVARLLQALGPADATAVRTAVGVGWYSIDLYERLVEALVETVGGGDEAVLDQVGEHTAESQAAGAYKVYYRAKDPAGLLESMAPMHSMLNDPGEMAVERQGETHVSLTVRAPTTSSRVCRIARAFYRRSVELSGGHDATVRETRCLARGGDECRFEVRWR